MRPIRALLIAEACNPEWASVPLVGWSHAEALARHCQAHLVTQVRNKAAIERAGLVEGRDFTAIDTEAIARRAVGLATLLRGGSSTGWTTATAVESLIYPVFERKVWRQFGQRIRSGAYDVVHRITPVSPTASSLLARRCARAGIPFVLGPLNGGVPWPREFSGARRREREWLSYVRGIYRLTPGYRSTRRHAAAILAGSRATLAEVPDRYRDKCFYLPENAISPDRFSQRRTRTAAKPLRAVFVGRLVPYKGADMLLDAAAPLVRSGQLELTIIGDGPQMPELREAIEREGIAAGVRLTGWVEHREVQRHMLDADVFAFPSIREFGGGVVLEAMATRLVPVVVDYGGPAELVTPANGYLVPLSDRAGIVAEFRRILATLAEDPRPLEAKSRLCLRRALEQFTWDAKATQVIALYRWLIDPSQPKPHFPMPMPDPADDDDARQPGHTGAAEPAPAV